MTDQHPPRRRSASVAAFLSFLWPGLGQWYSGRPRPALVYALPSFVILAVVVFAALDGLDVLAVELITPTVALTALILIVLVGLWRILSIVDAAAAGRPRRSRGAIGAIGVLLALVVVMHGVGAYYAWSAYDAGSRIFVGGGDGDAGTTHTPPPADAGSPSPGSSVDNSVDFEATPAATPATPNSRINVLVTGIDSGNGRDHALTDTLLVVSIDPETKKVAMLSFPRDIASFPLWDGRTYTGKINSLMTYARLHPKEFPDGGLPTLIKEIGYLLGVPIHYYAALNLEGFVRMVDLVGGVDIVNDQQISDPTYLWFDQAQPGFYLSAGRHHLDGRTALAYVRSRKGIGDSDFTRARRQQEVLLALRRQLTTPAMLTRIPDLLQAAGNSIRTDLPQDRVGGMVQLARGVTNDNVTQVVLGPPYAIHPPTNTTGGIYELRLDMKKLAALSIKLFGSDSRYATGGAPSP